MDCVILLFLKACPEKGGLRLSVLLVRCVCKEKDPGAGVCFQRSAAAREMIGQGHQEHGELQQEDFGRAKWQKQERKRTSRKEVVRKSL